MNKNDVMALFLAFVIFSLFLTGVLVSRYQTEYTKRIEMCLNADMKWQDGNCLPIE